MECGKELLSTFASNDPKKNRIARNEVYLWVYKESTPQQSVTT